MIKWKNFFVNLDNEVRGGTQFVRKQQSMGHSPLLLPIAILSAGAVSLQQTVTNTVPHNGPRMGAHKCLLLRLFPS
jgi:hypothetical protein